MVVQNNSIFKAFDAIQRTLEEQVKDTEFEAIQSVVRDEFGNSYCEIVDATEEFIAQ